MAYKQNKITPFTQSKKVYNTKTDTWENASSDTEKQKSYKILLQKNRKNNADEIPNKPPKYSQVLVPHVRSVPGSAQGGENPRHSDEIRKSEREKKIKNK